MDDGWGSLLVVLIIWSSCMFMEWRDKHSGRRRW